MPNVLKYIYYSFIREQGKEGEKKNVEEEEEEENRGRNNSYLLVHSTNADMPGTRLQPKPGVGKLM